MAKGRPKTALVFTGEEREQLENIAASRSLPVGLVTRVRIILLSASGKTYQQIQQQLGVSHTTVGNAPVCTFSP